MWMRWFLETLCPADGSARNVDTLQPTNITLLVISSPNIFQALVSFVEFAPSFIAPKTALIPTIQRLIASNKWNFNWSKVKTFRPPVFNDDTRGWSSGPSPLAMCCLWSWDLTETQHGPPYWDKTSREPRSCLWYLFYYLSQQKCTFDALFSKTQKFQRWINIAVPLIDMT